jgi:predicted ABC-type transport system involved in lysophospholipase L1 biosynthesis ATPase subunit
MARQGERAATMLRKGLEKRAKHKPGQLSGGEQQKWLLLGLWSAVAH